MIASDCDNRLAISRDAGSHLCGRCRNVALFTRPTVFPDERVRARNEANRVRD